MTESRTAWLIAAALTVSVSSGCHRSESQAVTDELVPKPPASWTSHMALMVSISDDGRLAAKVTADGKFVLVDVPGRKVVWTRNVKSHCVEAVALDPSGEHLAYPVDCDRVILEDIKTGSRVGYSSPAGNRSIHSIAVGDGGYPLAFGACGRGIYLIRGPLEAPVTVHPLGACEDLDHDAVHSLTVSRDSRLLAAGWGAWLDRWKTTPDERTHADWEDPGLGNSVGVSIWSVQDGVLRAELPGGLEGSTATFSGSGDFLAADYDSNRGVLSIWETRQGRRVRTIEGPLPHNPQFVQDGALLVGLMPYGPSSNPQIRVYSTETGHQVGGADLAVTDIMTRGHSGASASDKFLVAHRTGQVDVYRVSKDGHQIEKVWEF